LPPTGVYRDLAEQTCRLGDAAGRLVMRHYHADTAGDPVTKADDSPLTVADLESHQLLQAGLESTGLPILSEESSGPVMAERRDWLRYWLVDPLDGTREFLDRTGEFTVNIALVDAGRPVLGMVAVPGEGACYLGLPGQGAWRWCAGSWQDIRCRALGDDAPLVVHASSRYGGEEFERCLAFVQSQGRTLERRRAGSALKFCELARGGGDFYPRFAPCCEWDTAAGQAVLEGAGGAVLDTRGLPLLYNQRESLRSPHFLAIGDPANPLWQALIRQLDR
jgi:3'(2'), 5'-bisphosphate nucleotidase